MGVENAENGVGSRRGPKPSIGEKSVCERGIGDSQKPQGGYLKARGGGTSKVAEIQSPKNPALEGGPLSPALTIKNIEILLRGGGGITRFWRRKGNLGGRGRGEKPTQPDRIRSKKT